MVQSAPAAKRPLEEDDDTDMLSLMLLIGESQSAEIAQSAEIEELYNVLKQMGMTSLKRNDVSEIYSRPRVMAYAQKLGLAPGFALDLCTADPNDGTPWDFDVPARRDKVLLRVQTEQPKLLIGSPMCTAFSLLQDLSKGKGNIEEKKRLLARATKHVHFCITLYWERFQNGRYFLHQHPDSATSWQRPAMIQLLMHPDVIRTEGHMCTYGMKFKDAKEEGVVMKPTGWATNSPYIAEQVSVLSSNRWRGTKHRHVHLISGRAKAAEVYPPALCTAILKGLRRQSIADGLMCPKDIGKSVVRNPTYQKI